MIPAYSFEKVRDMLQLGYALRVVRADNRRSRCYVVSRDGRSTVGRVLADVRNRVLDELPLRLEENGRWKYDYAAQGKT